jgi:hypothetical protein
LCGGVVRVVDSALQLTVHTNFISWFVTSPLGQIFNILTKDDKTIKQLKEQKKKLATEPPGGAPQLDNPLCVIGSPSPSLPPEFLLTCHHEHVMCSPSPSLPPS